MSLVEIPSGSYENDCAVLVQIVGPLTLCIGCGKSVNPTGLSISENEKQRIHSTFSIGKNGTAVTLGLPDWGTSVIPTPNENVAAKLINSFRSLAHEDIVERIFKSFGGHRGSPSVVSNPLSSLPAIEINRAAIAHLVRKSDDNHIRYATLLRATLDEPTEAWLRDADGNRDQVHFLKKFNLSGQTITYMAVGDLRQKFLRTAYRLSGPAQAQRKREGAYMYASWNRN